MEISALELRFLVKELQPLIGAFIKRIYQFGQSFLFVLYKPGEGERWLYFDDRAIFLTQHRFEAPETPPPFCMLLRKYLMGKRISDIKQRDFDRILEIHTDENILVIELFGGGNVILCDKLYNIIMPLKARTWSSRELKAKKIYQPPPSHLDPFQLSEEEIFEKIKEERIGQTLAVNLGFGPFWSGILCQLIGTEPTAKVTPEIVRKLKDILRNISYQPCLYEERVTPFPLPDRRPLLKLSSLSEGLDRLFLEEWKKPEEGKREVIEKQKEEAISKWKKIEKEEREKAETIYLNYSEIQQAVSEILEKRRAGKSWEEIKAEVKPPVKEIRENQGVLVLEISGRTLELDIRKPIMQLAAEHFERAKKAKKKAERAEKVEIKLEKKPEKPKLKRRRRWWERFRWFQTSDGNLVIGGKDAKQNEELIKKRVEPEDRVFHAHIHGAAWVVLKGVTDIGRKEAAEFAAAYSKAWVKGLGTVDVFEVRPEQIKKEPGLPKGAFAVYGERIWHRDLEVKLAVGVRKEEPRVLFGPVMAMRKNSEYFVTIKPGELSGKELAQEIKNRILIKAKPED
ncbi:MAG: hypothetical protein DRP12_01260, partial [Candidatus Aenigmatarchaeota archaeon]